MTARFRESATPRLCSSGTTIFRHSKKSTTKRSKPTAFWPKAFWRTPYEPAFSPALHGARRDASAHALGKHERHGAEWRAHEEVRGAVHQAERPPDFI